VIERDYVTIVSGLPRSGTSMMIEMISQGGIPALTDDQRPPDIDNPRGYYEFQPVKRTREDPGWIPGAIGKVVKMVHLLLLDLPLSGRYRVVLMRRNLLEVVRSQNVMLERLGKSSQDLPQDRLIEVYGSQMEKVKDHMRSNPHRFQFMEADYGELIRDPCPGVREVSEFLGGLDVDRMRDVVEPTLYRIRVERGENRL